MVFRRIGFVLTLPTLMLLASRANADLVHQWKFNGHATDSVGSAHGTLSGGAALDGDRLSVDGQAGSRFLTSPIGNGVSEKTLISWLSLNDVTNSSKGSALTLENDANGGVFDGIVYGEVAAQKWMAGSNGFVRTENPQLFGTEETVQEPGEVMVSIVYAADNSITLYRNNAEYGSYTKSTLQPFDGNAVVQIGPRHGGNADVFAGFVNEARIYNTALDSSSISEIFAGGPDLSPSDPPPPPPAPALRHLWTFNGNLEDSVGGAHGTVTGGAQLVGDDINGRLSIDGTAGSRFLTSELGDAISAKTLVAWVSVNDVTNSSKGSALTIENDPTGSLFDGIVYGEVTAQKWMAGSNNFVRTQNPQEFGTEETVAEPGEVMVSIVYDDDGSITLYRDGEEYGSYSKGAVQPFSDTSVVQIGPRHGDHPDVFDGFVNEARVYSGALSAADMQGLFEAGPVVPEPGAVTLAIIAWLGMLGLSRRRTSYS